MRRWRKTKRKSNSALWVEYMLQLLYDSPDGNVAVYGRNMIKKLVDDSSQLTRTVLRQYYHELNTQKQIADNLKISRYKVAQIITFQRTRFINELGERERQLTLDFGGDYNVE